MAGSGIREAGSPLSSRGRVHRNAPVRHVVVDPKLHEAGPRTPVAFGAPPIPNPAYRLRRIALPRTPVNTGKGRGSSDVPRPLQPRPCGLGPAHDPAGEPRAGVARRLGYRIRPEYAFHVRVVTLGAGGRLGPAFRWLETTVGCLFGSSELLVGPCIGASFDSSDSLSRKFEENVSSTHWGEQGKEMCHLWDAPLYPQA